MAFFSEIERRKVELEKKHSRNRSDNTKIHMDSWRFLYTHNIESELILTFGKIHQLEMLHRLNHYWGSKAVVPEVPLNLNMVLPIIL
jgi:hypothetical protein